MSINNNIQPIEIKTISYDDINIGSFNITDDNIRYDTRIKIDCILNTINKQIKDITQKLNLILSEDMKFNGRLSVLNKQILGMDIDLNNSIIRSTINTPAGNTNRIIIRSNDKTFYCIVEYIDLNGLINIQYHQSDRLIQCNEYNDLHNKFEYSFGMGKQTKPLVSINEFSKVVLNGISGVKTYLPVLTTSII